jgi:hypothetical protein
MLHRTTSGEGLHNIEAGSAAGWLLADWIQRESTPEAGQAGAKEEAELQPPTFTRASQNMVTAAAL